MTPSRPPELRLSAGRTEERDTVESSDIVTASSAGVTDGTGPDPRRWGILAVVIVAQLMIVLDASIVTIALPSAQHALHISTPNRQWVITAYTLAFGGFLLLGGRIADFSGRKRMFVVGLLGFAGASALGGLAVNEAMLFAARALQGGFAALMAPAALSILTITFQHDAKERAQAFGAYGAVSGAGGAIGVLLGRRTHGVRLVAVVPAGQCPDRCPGLHRGGPHRAREQVLGVHEIRRARRTALDAGSGQPRLRLHQGGERRLERHGDHRAPARRGRPAHRVRLPRDEDQPSAPAAPGGARPEQGRCLPRLVAHGSRALRHVRVLELLPAECAALLGAQSGARLPALRVRHHPRCGRIVRARPTDRSADPDDGRPGHRRRWSGLADPDRGAQRFLGARRPAGDPDERRPGPGLPGLQQYRPHTDPRSRRRRGRARW